MSKFFFGRLDNQGRVVRLDSFSKVDLFIPFLLKKADQL